MKKVFIILGIFLAVLIVWLSIPFNILIIGVDAYANHVIRMLRFLVKIISRIKLHIHIILAVCNVRLTLWKTFLIQKLIIM